MKKTLKRLVLTHPDKIREVGDETSSHDGYWLYLRRGWTWDGCHSVHEWNMKDLLASFKRVEPCDCQECVTGKPIEDVL